MLIQPKPYIDKFKIRHQSFGVERRRNMSKIILENQTYFPKSIEYSDIDQEMFNWVDKKIDLAYDGVRLPTYKLYSTQRLSEYTQTWDQTDDFGNIIMNFKTITRENNPQRGDINGGYFNIPGHKDFAMYYVPVLQENGTEAYDKYTMKQPFGVNFMYSISIITNKMEVLNEMNEKMHYEFNAINCYIAPNGHPMSMSLEDVSDDSEYTIDDRKYYSQTYKVKVRGYIIRKEDYKVERIPSRFVIGTHDSDAAGIVNKRGRNRDKEDRVDFFKEDYDDVRKFELETMENDDNCFITIVEEVEKPTNILDEPEANDDCCINGLPRYRYKTVKVIMGFDECTLEMSFEMDKKIVIETVETTNVHDFRIFINDELMDLDNEITILKGDRVLVRISREDIHGTSEFILVGYDPDSVIDSEFIAETSLDEPYDEEHILVEPGEE